MKRNETDVRVAAGQYLFRLGGIRPPQKEMRRFIDEHHQTLGVESICKTFQTAPSGYWKHLACQRHLGFELGFEHAPALNHQWAARATAMTMHLHRPSMIFIKPKSFTAEATINYYKSVSRPNNPALEQIGLYKNRGGSVQGNWNHFQYTVARLILMTVKRMALQGAS